jgi:pimeloyl-ACP methyl ester carboxylesterase
VISFGKAVRRPVPLKQGFGYMEVPIPYAVLGLPMRDGSQIRARVHGNPDGPRLFVLHGNGYASDAYFPFWNHFTDRFEIIVFDLRNHGQNSRSSPERHTFREMTFDLEAVLESLDQRLSKKPRVGVFHSVSSLIAAKSAKDFGRRWDAVVLVDPPALPPKMHSIHDGADSLEDKLVRFALSRRRHFRQTEELAGEFRNSRSGANWIAGAHELMARSILRKVEDGFGYELVCPPELEARLYQEGFSSGVWPKASDFGGPALLIGADPSVQKAPPTAAINRSLAEEGGFRYAAIRGCGHLVQLEQPEMAAELVHGFMNELGI